MTALSQEDRDWLRKSRAASGVPEKVTDQHAINQVTTLVLSSETTRVMKTVKKSALQRGGGIETVKQFANHG